MRGVAIGLTLVVLAIALVPIAGCDAGDDTRVTVLLDAQRGARRDGASLRVRVLGTDGSVRLDDVRAIDAATAWPLRLPLVPEAGDAERTWAVEATLSDADGATLAIARLRGGYARGARREAGLCLADGCSSEPCGVTEGCAGSGACTTCVAGRCLDATAMLAPPGSAPGCPVSDCVPTGAAERACADGVDDDCDGRVDCLDLDCGCDAGACTAIGPEDTLEACHDGLDDDCDGRVDCEQGSACVLAEGPDGCDNGVDDDCDGLVDCLDPTCCVAPICDQRACGTGGLRCCDGACVNTWADERHCGACRLACSGTRQCNRVRAPDGTLAGAACRCGTASECPDGFTCETHDGSTFCNCPGDLRCPGRSICEMQGASFHAYCDIP